MQRPVGTSAFIEATRTNMKSIHFLRIDGGCITFGIGQWEPGFPSIRLAQTNALSLPNTFQAVILDTPVASGSVHSPYKQPVGARLARGGLAVAYGQSYPDYASNVALSASVDQASGTVVLIKFKQLGASSEIVATKGGQV